MESKSIQAEVRKEGGKGESRRLRASSRIPAVFYGPGKTTTSLHVSPHELTRALSTPHGRNVVIKLELGGSHELALIKDLDVHPVTRALLHADFYSVDERRPVEVHVPFRTKGKSLGVQKGGELHVTLRALPVRTTLDKIPSLIEVDVSHLELHDVIAVQDVKLEEGVVIALEPNRTLVAVTTQKKVVEETEATAAPGAAPAGASTPPPGGKGTPSAAPAAAAGKAPAAGKAAGK